MKPLEEVSLGESRCSRCKLSRLVQLGQNFKYFLVQPNKDLGLPQCEMVCTKSHRSGSCGCEAPSHDVDIPAGNTETLKFECSFICVRRILLHSLRNIYNGGPGNCFEFRN